MPKYSISDDHGWADEQQEDFDHQPVSVDSHEIDIIHTTDPTEDMGYGRDKYTVNIIDEKDGQDTPYALMAVKHRWKGNFWREHLELDWRDLPSIVQRRVASVVAGASVDELDPGCRLIEEGGRSHWSQRSHDNDE